MPLLSVALILIGFTIFMVGRLLRAFESTNALGNALFLGGAAIAGIGFLILYMQQGK